MSGNEEFAEIRKAIDACKYLSLCEISEDGDDYALRVVVEELKPVRGVYDLEVAPGTILTGIRDLEYDPTCSRFELTWPLYVAYSVRNESFVTPDDSEIYDGRLLRVYSKSHFRDYIASATFATDEYPGPLVHWSLCCVDHIVDVVSHSQPKARRA